MKNESKRFRSTLSLSDMHPSCFKKKNFYEMYYVILDKTVPRPLNPFKDNFTVSFNTHLSSIEIKV